MRKFFILIELMLLILLFSSCVAKGNVEKESIEKENVEKEITVNKVEIDSNIEEVTETEYFSDTYFRANYVESTMSTTYTRKQSTFEIDSMNERYFKDNALDITKEIFEKEYDIEVIEGEDNHIYHIEYWEGYPTGAYAKYYYDDYGIIQKATFGKGVYVEDKSGFITVEEAYSKGIDGIYDKYGKDTVMYGSFEDSTYIVYYNPSIEKVCYCIENVSGIVGDKDEIYNPVKFIIFISVDGSYMEIASTLMY